MEGSKINIVDLLLAQDASKIRDLPTAQIRITRLSDIIGADFCLEIRALTGAEIESMPDGMEGIDRKILTAVKNFDFTDAQLRGKFTPEGRCTPLTPTELIDVLLLPGEKIQIVRKINDLSGYTDDAVEVIKKTENGPGAVADVHPFRDKGICPGDYYKNQPAKNFCWRPLYSRCMTTRRTKKCQKLLKHYLYCATTIVAR